jgi:hypothetical protein
MFHIRLNYFTICFFILCPIYLVYITTQGFCTY